MKGDDQRDGLVGVGMNRPLSRWNPVGTVYVQLAFVAGEMKLLFNIYEAVFFIRMYAPTITDQQTWQRFRTHSEFGFTFKHKEIIRNTAFDNKALTPLARTLSRIQFRISSSFGNDSCCSVKVTAKVSV